MDVDFRADQVGPFHHPRQPKVLTGDQAAEFVIHADDKDAQAVVHFQQFGDEVQDGVLIWVVRRSGDVYIKQQNIGGMFLKRGFQFFAKVDGRRNLDLRVGA